jgi:glycerophosphoryl diester phosphodiesterase
LKLDFGVKFGEKYKGLKIVRFEDILQKLGGRVIMNVHIKTPGGVCDDWKMKKIVSLVRKYECEKHVYFMISDDDVIRRFHDYAPDIEICVGHNSARPWEIVERAMELGMKKVQLFTKYCTREMIEKAHANGIKCNYFYADTPEKAIAYMDMGIDTLLTNDYLNISNVLRDAGKV